MDAPTQCGLNDRRRPCPQPLSDPARRITGIALKLQAFGPAAKQGQAIQALEDVRKQLGEKLAQAQNIDLKTIQGSGPGGRRCLKSRWVVPTI